MNISTNPSTIALATILLMSAGCSNGDSNYDGSSSAPSSGGPPPAVAPDNSGGPAPADDATVGPIEEGWGDLRIRFVYDGAPPTPARLSITKDVNVCGQHPLVNESLLVGTDGGVANVVVWLADRDVKIHPSYAESALATVVIDNKNCRFEPHVCVLRTSQTLSIHNSDTVSHNTKGDLLANSPFNQIIPAGGSIEKVFTQAERLPANIGCNIHPWMSGRLVVQDHPYVAVSDERGEIHLSNLSSGKLTFMAWQEAAGYVSEVTIDGQSQSWRRGKFEFAIHPGENDMGQVHVKADLFAN